MHLSDLQGKDIVNVNDGTKIGSIIDVIIDNNGSIVSMIVQGNKFFSNLFSQPENFHFRGGVSYYHIAPCFVNNFLHLFFKAFT